MVSSIIDLLHFLYPCSEMKGSIVLRLTCMYDFLVLELLQYQAYSIVGVCVCAFTHTYMFILITLLLLSKISTLFAHVTCFV